MSVADPGFPGGGAPTPLVGGEGGWAIDDFAKFPPKNCMKLKEFGPPREGARHPRAP